MSAALRSILGFGRTVADLACTEAFYRDGLGFVADGSPVPVPSALRHVLGLGDARAMQLRMRLGAQSLDFLALDPPGRPYPGDPSATDPIFQHVAIPVRRMEDAYERLRAVHSGPISEGGPQRLPASSGGVSAFKFRDPDGHPVELLFFPYGPSAQIWAEAPGLFLGIDHSAITVTDLDAALAFFTGLLGLKPVQRGLNRGPEQGRLDGLDAPVVDVIALAPAGSATPHLELLHYRQPAPEHRTLSPYGPRDRATTRTLVRVGDVAATAEAIRAAGYPVTVAPGAALAYARGPDGHGLVLRAT